MNNSLARLRYVIAGILVLSSSTATAAPQNDVMLALDNSGSMRKNEPIFLARGANELFVLSEPAIARPEPVGPPSVKTLEATVITPLPDDTVTFQPLPAPQDPAADHELKLAFGREVTRRVIAQSYPKDRAGCADPKNLDDIRRALGV